MFTVLSSKHKTCKPSLQRNSGTGLVPCIVAGGGWGPLLLGWGPVQGRTLYSGGRGRRDSEPTSRQLKTITQQLVRLLWSRKRTVLLNFIMALLPCSHVPIFSPTPIFSPILVCSHVAIFSQIFGPNLLYLHVLESDRFPPRGIVFIDFVWYNVDFTFDVCVTHHKNQLKARNFKFNDFSRVQQAWVLNLEQKGGESPAKKSSKTCSNSKCKKKRMKLNSR